MESKKLLVFVATVFVLAVSLIAGANAFANLSSVEVNGVEGLVGGSIAAFSGETLPVRVVFSTFDDAEDVRVKVWIAGEKDLAVSSERFDVLSGRTYSRLVNVKVPSNIDPSEDFELMVGIESRADGQVALESVTIAGQREAYAVDVLDVTMGSRVQAGNDLVLGVVLKNRGMHLAEDTFVSATIPALGISDKVYFGDLSAVDQSDPDKEDAVEGKVFLKIPSNAASGVYVVEVEAFNSDSIAKETRKVAIVGASENTIVVAPATSKTFASGEKAVYSLTLVNSDNSAKVYDLTFETADGLTIDADENVFVVPAGSSKTVKLSVSAPKSGDYTFSVNVNSNGELVKKVELNANVEGKNAAGNATVLLTVILAIIFVVLLVVLIILLTRKPEKSEELGESYY